jgi:hypothetical protein
MHYFPKSMLHIYQKVGSGVIKVYQKVGSGVIHVACVDAGTTDSFWAIFGEADHQKPATLRLLGG